MLLQIQTQVRFHNEKLQIGREKGQETSFIHNMQIGKISEKERKEV